MPTEWRPIESFPGYSVSDTGYVMNDETGHLMTMLVNQAGVVNVGLTKNRVQYKRAVARLVATAFIKTRPNESFDSPINLDGDRHNNNVSNLMWRPRWFATKYFQQFEETEEGLYFPVEEADTKEWFDSPLQAAVTFGLLMVDVLLSVNNSSFVWPTQQKFRSAFKDRRYYIAS